MSKLIAEGAALRARSLADMQDITLSRDSRERAAKRLLDVEASTVAFVRDLEGHQAEGLLDADDTTLEAWRRLLQSWGYGPGMEKN